MATQGTFTVGATGKLSFDFLFDGGKFQGELAVFSLKGMENLEVGSTAFIQEATRRALTNSTQGRILVSDGSEGAKFSAQLDWEDNFNSGTYKGIKNFSMQVGDQVAFMLIPNGTVNQTFGSLANGLELVSDRVPLFSISAANPDSSTQFTQVEGIEGRGNVFAMEDVRLKNGSDYDYNDLVFQLTGAEGNGIPAVDDVSAVSKDWIDTAIGQQITDYASRSTFNSGVFRVDDSGQVGVDYLYDGGWYQGEMAIFSLKGMEGLQVDSYEFVQEATRRALSNSTQGHIVIQDRIEGARYTAKFAWEDGFNASDYKGVKTYSMNAGEDFAVMLIQNSTVQELANDVTKMWSGNRLPIFSIPQANIGAPSSIRQIVDVTGRGDTFGMEDVRTDWGTMSDKDYNDMVFRFTGATGVAPLMDSNVNRDRDWRNSSVGQELVQYATRPKYSGGIFDTGESGKVRIDFLHDGGWYQSELAIFSLDGMENLKAGSAEFIQEASRRALSESNLGHVVIKDQTDAAKFSDQVAWEADFNSGAYKGAQTFGMAPRGHFAFMLVQNNTVAAIANDISIINQTGNLPMFSIPEANPFGTAVGQMVNVDGKNTYAFEDNRLDLPNISDRDYNDIVIQVKGATSDVPLMNNLVNPERDWRTSDSGKELLAYANRAEYDKGVISSGQSGTIEVEFLYDGGYYKGDVGIFSLDGMDAYAAGSAAFIAEAARRVASNSTQGYVLLSDTTDAAKFTSGLDWESNFNSGTFKGTKILNLAPNSSYGVIQIPNGTISEVIANPAIDGTKRPLFSMLDNNPSRSFQMGKTDVGNGSFVVSIEDQRLDGVSDRDYNDIIFRIKGDASVSADTLDRVMAANKDWRSTEMGQTLINYASNPSATTSSQFLFGFSWSDTLQGTDANEYISGGAGNDILIGGKGNDILVGGFGNDTFLFNNINQAGDTVLDFGAGDAINLKGVLSSINYQGSNAIADGFVRFQQLGTNTVVQVSPDGLGNNNNLVNLLTVNNTNITAVSNSLIF
jgi:Ca2+-binding RTX toxin-like protein